MRAYDLIELAKNGWVTQYDDVAIADAPFSADLQNYRPNPIGALKLERGYEILLGQYEGTSLAPLVCLFGASVEDLTSGVVYSVMIYSGNGVLVAQELDSGSEDNIAAANTIYNYSLSSATLLGAALDKDAYWDYCVYQDKIYVFNGATGYVIWRDTTWQIDELDAGYSTDPAPVGVRIPRMYLGRMWLGLNRDLYHSEVSPDTDEFPAANMLNIQSPGGNFSSMEVWERDLFVYLDRNIISIPYADDPEYYVEIDMGTGWGCIAPDTLRRCGSHGLVCLSDAGVKSFPGMVNLSGLIDETLSQIQSEDQAIHRLRGAYGFYNEIDDSYNLLISSGVVYNTKYYNDQWWKYFFRTDKWIKVDMPAMRSIGAVIHFGKAGRRLITGTYGGYICWHSDEESHGGDTHSGTATAGSANTLTDSEASFTVAGDHLWQQPVYIVAGTGAGQRRIISSNTATVLTLETNWDTNPSTDSVYMVCAQRGRFETPWLHFGEPFKQKRVPELHFSVDQDAVDQRYKITLFRDFESAAAKTIRGTFSDQNCIVPLDMRARHLKIRIETFTITGRPVIRGIRLYAGKGTYA